MIEKILNNTTPYGKIRASREGSLHSSTLNHTNHVTHACLHDFLYADSVDLTLTHPVCIWL